MKLSCTCSMVPGNSLTEKANNLKKWGYDGMGVFVEYSDWNEALKQEIMDLEKNTGIVPCEFVFMDDAYGHLMDDRQIEVRDKTRYMYKEAAKFCAQIGAITELEYEYGAQNPLPLFSPYAKIPADKEPEFISAFSEIAAAVEGTDAYVLLEPINRYEASYLNNVDDCIEVIKKVSGKNAGMLLDTFHLSIEERDIPQKIREAGNLIKYVHLGDNNRLMPGYGNLDWKEIIDALLEIGYDGYMSLECSPSGAPENTLPVAALFLRSLM